MSSPRRTPCTSPSRSGSTRVSAAAARRTGGRDCYEDCFPRGADDDAYAEAHPYDRAGGRGDAASALCGLAAPCSGSAPARSQARGSARRSPESPKKRSARSTRRDCVRPQRSSRMVRYTPSPPKGRPMVPRARARAQPGMTPGSFPGHPPGRQAANRRDSERVSASQNYAT
jgi:hypothetical protein